MIEMIARLENELAPLKEKLLHHPIYGALQSIDDMKTFTQTHVFAVWDFMSLVKKLQIELTCVSLPWKPAPYPTAARLINEIVWGEESDVNQEGVPMSHFEMYLTAMRGLEADIQPISNFLENLPQQGSPMAYIQQSDLPEAIKQFLGFTFEIIETKPLHQVAAVFTFGREDLIPDMFIEMIRKMKVEGTASLKPMIYYLERHIEVDGDQHGPMALEMIQTLCQNDPLKWEEVISVSKQALEQRIALWDSIFAKLSAPLQTVTS